MRETDAPRKPFRAFSALELAAFRAGRSAARRGEGMRSDVFAEDLYFQRGFNQERLLVRSEDSEIHLVAGIAVICQRCHVMRLYEAPGCGCWNTAEVVELADWMKAQEEMTPRIAELLKQYRLEYGVLMHRPALGNFSFMKMDQYRQSLTRIHLPVLQYPTGEAFFLAAQ